MKDKSDLTKRLLLKQKIHEYINNKISLIELENSELFVTNSQNEKKLLEDVFHAICHFDMDINEISNTERFNMRQKLENIANGLTENDECLEKAIKTFFNDPYSARRLE